jgi:hypothetical protein
MKVLTDNKASFVKNQPLSASKALLIEEMKEAIEEINLVKAGKKKARNAEEFLNGIM